MVSDIQPCQLKPSFVVGQPVGTKAFSITYAYWFLWKLYLFDCLKSKAFQMEWPELVEKYLPNLMYISQVIVCEVYW